MFAKLILLLSLAASLTPLLGAAAVDNEFQLVHVGVLLDFNSAIGSVADICMSMALKDFYDLNSNYKTRIVLQKRHSEDVATTALSAANLLEKDEVAAIIGPQTFIEAIVVTELGRKFQVPVITFSVTSPSISPAKYPYFVRTSQDDSHHAHALADVILDHGLREIVLIYEDTIYADGIVPYFTDELLKSNIKIIHKCAFQKEDSGSQISNKLNKMRSLKPQVFLVHMMTTSLGYQIFDSASDLGLLSRKHIWFITGGLSNSLSYLVPLISMNNVIGIKPYIPKSTELSNFNARWMKKFYSTKSDVFLSEPNIFGLWAYDTIYALAKAVEDSWTLPVPLSSKSPANDSKPFSHSGKSQECSRLLNNIFNSEPIQGLSGEFHIVNGQLQPSPLEIIIVEGYGVSVAGFWIPDKGFSKSLLLPEIASPGDSFEKPEIASTEISSQKPEIASPGDSFEKPLESGISQTKEKKLKIAVPTKLGFPGMVYEGYCIDVFTAAFETLPDLLKFDYELQYYHMFCRSCNSEAYNELLYDVYKKRMDAVVGDTTVLANRWYVDFTLPYSDPGIAIVVPRVKISGYIFYNLKHFYLELWMAVIVVVIGTPLLLSFIRWIKNENAQTGNFWDRWSTQVASIFGNGENESDIRRNLLVMTFVVLTHVIVSVYFRSYKSPIIAENQNQIVDLYAKDVYIGYQSGSTIVKDLLLKKLKIDESRIKGYSSLDDYDLALSKGSANGGVSAIIDETPYLKLFLAKHNSMYKLDGRTYRSQGFAFAFPMGSPLVSLMSKAILNITKSGKIEELEHKYFRV